jgi:histidinol-phosphate aminotransferase
MSRFWSDHVHRLSPYVPGEQPKSAQLVKLNTNENPYPPSQRAQAVLGSPLGDELRLYPDPGSVALREAAAGRQGLGAEQAFAGNGSDEVLALAFAAFFGSRAGFDGPLLFPDVSYSFYPVWADFFGIAWQPVPLADDFSLDLAHQLYREGRGGIVFANPNAPTGIALPVVEIEALLRATPDRVVVVDEAYVEFGAESAAPLVARHDNLLVVQTLSKSHALAGLRVGFAFGSPELIAGLDRVKSSFNSYPVDRIAERVATEALADRAWLDECRDRIVATREWTSERLRGLGFEVLPSSANFVFARHGEVPGAKLMQGLRAHDVLVRHFALPRIDDHLRITIGTDDEMKQLISVLESLLGG